MDERITREEVEKCVKRQKNGNTAGPDEILYDVYKNGEVVIDKMTELFNQVWEERVPRMWNECRVTLLHKGRHKNDIVVMSESAEELQSLLDVVDGYGRDFGVRF
ncbi:hypothetical protein E2C01_069574 [Portunus trituberculatus]|uniref:Uncharacterized protein n=1 Tax=Portunus trituberculatus TaxID=210409 RepID=A0A5B7HRX2_PORTR|nr:hypothetical protein [Portunus trituberculatus]